jgi:hypothetical protein
MPNTEEKKAIRVLRERSLKSFEDKCNGLVQQGYHLQTCGYNSLRSGNCGLEEYWFAVFSSTETMTQPG